MTWFADLSEYSYDLQAEQTPCRNIGWLAHGHEFERGPAPDGFLARLRVFCQIGVHRTSGFHRCQLPGCADADDANGGEDDEDLDILAFVASDADERHGAAEIRAFGADGVVYAAPDLIVHYVEEHEYLPPRAFVDAVLAGPQPRELAYARALVDHTPDLSWLDKSLFKRIKVGWWQARKWRKYARTKAQERATRRQLQVHERVQMNVDDMVERHGLSDEYCRMTGCPEQALQDKSFCVHHTPIDPDIVLANA